MKHITTILLLSYAIVCSAGSPIAGKWKGELNVGGTSLPIIFNIEAVGDSITATLDSPAQNAYGIPCSKATFSAASLSIEIAGLRASYSGILQPDSNSIKGDFIQGLKLSLDMSRDTTGNIGKTPKRPQTPKPPFPYRCEDVIFRNTTDDVSLAGTLTLPATGSKFTAVVLITGSGAQNRDEELYSHKPFGVIADYLTRNGIAVLRYDDRGTGASTGRFASATTADFSRDAKAAFDYLLTRNEIDPKSIGYIGHSEGGLIAIINAATDKRTAFIVTLAGPATKGSQVMVKQNELIAKVNGHEITEKERADLTKIFGFIETIDNTEQLKDSLQSVMLPAGIPFSEQQKEYVNTQISGMTSAWYRSFIKSDPTPMLKSIRCPIFALNGSLDAQVSSTDNLASIKRNATKSKKVETREYESLNHLFQHCPNLANSMKYNDIEETISQEVLKDMAQWILSM